MSKFGGVEVNALGVHLVGVVEKRQLAAFDVVSLAPVRVAEEGDVSFHRYRYGRKQFICVIAAWIACDPITNTS